MKKIDKKEIYKHENFTVATYDFEIPNGEQSWDVLKLVELKVTKKKWFDGMDSYYKQSQYITISKDQLIHLVENLRAI